MSVREVFWGLVPDMTGTFFLSQLVGADVAKELVFTARIFDGREAKALGLATKLSDTPYDDAMALAREIAGRSPDAVRAAKQLMNGLYHQGAAEQALGIAESRNRRVDLRSRGRKGRKAGSDHHGGDILGVHGRVAGIDAKALEHGFEALLGEGGVSKRVAGAVQAHDNAVTNQHIVSYAFESDNVLDPRLGQNGRRYQSGRGQGGDHCF
jgi:hypothetical protein